jgi:urease accessory protein
MDNRLPTNFFEGFISGLAHPIIRLDHFAFVVVIGLLAAAKPHGLMLPMTFVSATLVGTGLHLGALNLPAPELLIAGSVLLFGLLLAVGNRLGTVGTALLAGVAGLFHGFAYGEAIVGAEMTPLIAYLLGFTLVQLAVSLAAYGLGKRFMAQPNSPAPKAHRSLQAAGWMIGGVGLALAYAQLAG